ncbi:nuclear pore complex protein NUP205 [Tanacetum coccineum]
MNFCLAEHFALFLGALYSIVCLYTSKIQAISSECRADITRDSKALGAYLCVLRKVMEIGNPIKRKTWCPNIEPLFKLLSYENVPPYLKGALRLISIATFIMFPQSLKVPILGVPGTVRFSVVVGLQLGIDLWALRLVLHELSKLVYDMRFELNEVEARSEHYPSTISFLNLLNSHIIKEKDATDSANIIHKLNCAINLGILKNKIRENNCYWIYEKS